MAPVRAGPMLAENSFDSVGHLLEFEAAAASTTECRRNNEDKAEEQRSRSKTRRRPGVASFSAPLAAVEAAPP